MPSKSFLIPPGEKLTSVASIWDQCPTVGKKFQAGRTCLKSLQSEEEVGKSQTTDVRINSYKTGKQLFDIHFIGKPSLNIKGV